MTTIVYDRRTKTIAADTQNTDRTGGIYRTSKIEKLKDGRLFLGAGNCYTICATRRWAEAKFDPKKRPEEYACIFSDPDEYSFSCLIISPDGLTVTIVDDEMEPLITRDDYLAIGSGGPYALGAMDKGATALEAVEIACNRDGNTSAPIDVVQL